MSETTALRVEGLRVSFGPVQVLTDVNLTVPERSFTAVLGASGSGKTTLLRTIAGFERPGSGSVELAGQTVNAPGRHVPPERRHIGYVAQEGALFPHLTVAGNVGFGMGRGKRSAGRIDELLDLVGLAGLQRRYPHELSGGQQQRVALARALALSPSLVLLDEPFASLDAALRTSMRADIARVLRAADTSVVLVTHDQQEALSLADQVVVLRQGRVAQVGEPRQLYARPGDPDLARFLGEANLVPAEIRDAEAITALGTLPTEPSQWASGIALIRPEQIAVGDTFDSGEGMAAVVSEQTYHGHDSMVTLRPVSDCGIDEVRARVPGDRVFSPGDKVLLRAAGQVPTWPAAEH
jgi:iron(III) transport system ATP-binding protein